MSLSVLYRDRDMAVIVKPVGVLSEDHPTEPCVPTMLRDAIGNPQAYVGTVHRLDKQVGGLMVYALTPTMTGRLSNALSEEGAGKEYLAVLQVLLPDEEGTLCDLLYHDKQKNKTYVVKRKRGGVKEASLSYRVLKRQEGKTLVRVQLHTGRTHQIRVQFASRRSPLVGDGRYGGGGGIPALFAFRLSFRHPRTGEMVCYVRLPEDNRLGGLSLDDLEEII